MKRLLILGIIVCIGVASMLTANVLQQAPQGTPPAGGGQARGGGGGGGVGSIMKVAENLYMIPGAGGNTAVFITANGVVLVDTKNPNNGQGILDQVRTVTNKNITHIINTHTHGDHNGSNIFFPANVEIVVHEKAQSRMEKMPMFMEAGNKHGLADRTYRDRMTLLNGNDAIDLYHFGPAHTDGDTFVVFRALRTMHAGDVFANKGQPLIDVNNGGSGIAYPETIAKAASAIKNVEIVINGHITSGPSKWQDFVDFGEFNRLFLEHARASLKAGKTAEQAMADLKLPDKFKDYNLAGGRGGPGGNFGVIYKELQGK
jgi:glyoxylase-like metal-dependent hydrolase (beta-lactamase superfamily II)